MIQLPKTKLMSVLFLTLISFSFTLSAQQTNKHSSALLLLQAAEQYASENNFQLSSQKALESIPIFENQEDWKHLIDAYRVLFDNCYETMAFPETIGYLEKGKLKIPDEQIQHLAKINFFLGACYEVMGDVPTSVQAYRQSAQQFEAVQDIAWLVPSLTNLGLGYIQTGDYPQAINYLKKAIYLERNKADPDYGQLYSAYYNLGDAYFYQGVFEAARKSYANAHQIFDAEDGSFEFNNAKIFLEQNKFKQAMVEIRKAIAISQTIAGLSDHDIAVLEKMVGEIYLRSQQPQKARRLFLKIVPLFQAHPNTRALGKLFINIADSYADEGQLDDALDYYQRALNTFLPHFKKRDPRINPDKKNWIMEIWLMEIFRQKAKCFLQKYESESNEHWLDLAEQNYQLAIDFIQEIKLNFETTAAQLSIGTYTHSFYEEVIELMLLRYEISTNPSHLEAAFRAAQMANAFVLRTQLNEQKALNISGVPATLKDSLQAQQQAIIELNKALSSAQPNTIDSIQNLIFDHRQAQQNIKAAIKEKYPAYTQFQNELEVVSSAEIQEFIASDQLFLKYFLGKETVFIFSISQHDFQIDSIPLPTNFNEILQQYRQSISDLGFIKKSEKIAEQQYLQSAYQLFQLLLEKPLNHHTSKTNIQRLSIVADGVLNTIPFQALLCQKSTSWKNSKPLVLSRYAVSYSYFSKMILTTSANNYQGNFVSFGIEFDDYTLAHLKSLAKDSIEQETIFSNLRSGKFSKLPFSDNEAQELAEFMDGQHWLNQQATKANFLQHTPEAKFIHIATHSLLDPQRPEQSSLIFIKQKDSLDNLLRLEEIYTLQLQANLIVLSACNTGFGQGQKGEGINSLARAFHYAGIPSVTATFWSISDEASIKLMKLYYRNLKDGMSKDIALQQAQLEYLNNDQISSPAFRSPVYWAAWMPVGSNAAIEPNPSNYQFFFISLLLIGIACITFFILKKRVS